MKRITQCILSLCFILFLPVSQVFGSTENPSGTQDSPEEVSVEMNENNPETEADSEVDSEVAENTDADEETEIAVKQKEVEQKEEEVEDSSNKNNQQELDGISSSDDTLAETPSQSEIETNKEPEPKNADDVLKWAESLSDYSERLNVLVDGHHSFPDDSRLIEGIHITSRELLNSARLHHIEGNYSIAINLYEQLLNTPTLTSIFLESTRKHLAFARAEKAIPDAEDLYYNAINASNVSSIFNMFVEGYIWYPQDSRFSSGVQTSSESLFTWAVRQHDRGGFSTAINRYQMILTAPIISDNLRNKVEERLYDAQIGKRPAQIIFTAAVEETSASKKLSLFTEGHKFYPDDERFKEGILSSTQSLFTWAANQHRLMNYETAISRYYTILDTPLLSNQLKETTGLYLDFALLKRVVPTADNLYDHAKKQTQVSAIFKAYMEGFELHPTDQRFINGVQTSSQQLFDWAIRQHNNGQFNIAIDRYNMLLHSPLDESFKQEVKRKMEDAEIGKRSDDSILTAAEAESSASRKLNLYLEGVHFYPSDNRFVQGVQTSSQLLLDWTTKQHNLGNYDVSLDRYNFLLSINNLQSTIKKKISIQIVYATNNEKIPNPDSFYSIAMGNATLSGRMAILLDGYTIHGETKQLISGINETARLLLDWAGKQHDSGNFSTAKDRYLYVLSAPGLNNTLKSEATLKLQFAEKEQNIPTAQVQYEIASSQTSASHMLTKFEEGHILYPNDTRFMDGINHSARTLISWASSQHQNKNYTTATDRFQRIIALSQVEPSIKKEAEIRLSYSIRNTMVPTATQFINQSKNESTISGKMNLLEISNILYPSNSYIKTEINKVAEELLVWSSKQHNNRNFSTAIDRYERIINLPSVNNKVKFTANIQLRYAKNNNLLPSSIAIGTLNSSSSLKAGAGPSFNDLATLPKDTLVEIIRREINGWLQVRTSNNIVGFIDSSKVFIEYLPTGSNIGPLSNRVIILDPGHGGKDPGAIAGGIMEKELVLDIALRAKQLLENAGAIVVMTRSTDVFLELAERSAIANSTAADIFISLHANSFNSLAQGTETFWYSRHEAEKSERLAHAIQDATVSKLGTHYRRVDKVDYHVVRETKIPSALLEFGFLDNPSDASKLRLSSYRQLAAEGLLAGIINYFY